MKKIVLYSFPLMMLLCAPITAFGQLPKPNPDQLREQAEQQVSQQQQQPEAVAPGVKKVNPKQERNSVRGGNKLYNQEKYVESEIEYRKAVDANPDSPLAKESDVCLSTGHPDEVCALGMTPTTSTTVMTVIGDILVVETMKRTGFTIEDYSKRHHGGYLGEKSRSLCEK